MSNIKFLELYGIQTEDESFMEYINLRMVIDNKLNDKLSSELSDKLNENILVYIYKKR